MTEPAPLIAWTALDIVALEVLIGVLACRLWLLPIAASALYPVQARRLDRLGLACLVVLSIASVALLVITAQEMSGAPYVAITAVLPTVVRATHYGHAWIVRAVCVLALWGLMVAHWPTLGGARQALLMWVLVAVVAFTRSTSGHAVDAGHFNTHEISDWLHVLITALWAGSVIAAALAVFPVNRAGMACGAQCLTRQGQRISQLATTALGGMLATGIYNAWCTLSAVSQLWTSVYGERLLIKLALVGLMLALGAVNRFWHLPGLAESNHAARFTRLLYVEATVAAAALAMVAVMINTSPPR
jgi:putative copper resistance protein D